MFEYKTEYKQLSKVCLNVTDSCNLQCKYCFVEQNPHFMTYQTAIDTVHFLLDNKQKYNIEKNCQIIFFGGEPTLCWDSIIVPLTNYVRNNNLPISFSMTTNGTLLNQERIHFLKNNRINILLSIDGNEETQCFNRPCRDNNLNSFELVSKNIPYIIKELPQTTFRGTIFAPTVQNTFNNFLFACENHFKAIYLAVDERHDWKKEQIQQLLLELDKIFSLYDYCFQYDINIPIDFRQMTKMFRNIKNLAKNNFNDFEHNVLRCGLGTTLASVGYDGKIYGCQEQTSKDEKNIFLIGDIYNGIDEDKHKRLLSLYKDGHDPQCINKELCNNCIRLCEGNCCPSTNLDIHQDFFLRSEIVCLYEKHLYENCMILLNKYNEKESKVFNNYLKQYCYFPKKGDE